MIVLDPNNTGKASKNVKVSFVKQSDVSEDKNIVTDDYTAFFSDLEDEMSRDSKGNNNIVSENKRHSEPSAWCRLLMIDHRHKLRGGYYSLHLWKVPVFKYEKGGPKVDPYATGFWKKYGTTSVKSIQSGNDAFLTLNNSSSYVNSTSSSARSSAKVFANSNVNIATTQFNGKSTSKRTALVGRNGGGRSSPLSPISSTNSVSILKFGIMAAYGNAINNNVDDFNSYNYNYNYNNYNNSDMNKNFATADEASCDITTNASTQSQQNGLYDGGMVNSDLSFGIILDIEFPHYQYDVVYGTCNSCRYDYEYSRTPSFMKSNFAR